MDALTRYNRSNSATMIRRAQEEGPTAENHFFIALKLADEKDLESAVRWFRVSLSLDPNYRDAAWYLAKVLFDLGRYEEAEQACLQVEDFAHLHGERAEFLGEICRLTGRYEEARDFYFEALRESERPTFRVHLGLTELLQRGVDVGMPFAQMPLVDERIAVRSGGLVSHCRLRIFSDRTSTSKKVVIFTSEHDAPAGSTSVTNAAEILIKHVLESPQYQVDETTATWVTMHEATFIGTKPMHVSKLSFRLRTEVGQGTGWRLPGFLGLAKPPIYKFVEHLRFNEITHPQLELMCAHRFFWG